MQSDRLFFIDSSGSAGWLRKKIFGSAFRDRRVTTVQILRGFVSGALGLSRNQGIVAVFRTNRFVAQDFSTNLQDSTRRERWADSAPSVLLVPYPVNRLCHRTVVRRVPLQTRDALHIPLNHLRTRIQLPGSS